MSDDLRDGLAREFMRRLPNEHHPDLCDCEPDRDEPCLGAYEHADAALAFLAERADTDGIARVIRPALDEGYGTFLDDVASWEPGLPDHPPTTANLRDRQAEAVAAVLAPLLARQAAHDAEVRTVTAEQVADALCAALNPQDDESRDWLRDHAGDVAAELGLTVRGGEA